MQKGFLLGDGVKREIVRHLTLFVGYALVFLALYALSKNFFTHKGWSTWFMPLGARLALLLILPWRYWPTLLFCEFLCNRGITYYYGNVPLALGLSLLKAVVARSVFAASAFWMKHKFPHIDLAKPTYILALLSLALFHATFNAADLVYFTAFYKNIPANQKLEMWLSFTMGSCIGMLLIAPLMLGCWQWWQQQPRPSIHPLLQQAAYLAIGFVGAYMLFHAEPGAMYLLTALGLLPVLYFAFRFGWMGAVLSLFLLNLFICAALYGQSGTLTMQQVQVFVLLMNVVGLGLGALMSTQHQLTSELRQSLSQQQELAVNNQRLAEKYSTLQEDERKRVSDELHDDLGQTITALKLHTSVLARQASPAQHTGLTQISQGIDQLYESVYRMMHQLRPRLLEVYGLSGALTQGALPAMMQTAQISYHTEIAEQADSLPDHLKILLFRIAQEALTNTVKHSGANQCWLTLALDADSVLLEIKDNGKGTTQGTSGGFGLQTLQERVSAYSGSLSFSHNVGDTMTDQSSAVLSVRLPLPQHQQ